MRGVTLYCSSLLSQCLIQCQEIIEMPQIMCGGGAWWAAVYGVTKSRKRLSDFTSLFTFMHWRRKRQPTPVFLPGESQGRGSLVGCRPWGHTESDTTRATWQQQQQQQQSRHVVGRSLCLAESVS